MASLIDSASILVIRDGETGLEVLMMKRHADIDFAGGAYVFPGGKLDQDDLNGEQEGASFPPGYKELVQTAYREVFEESGLIIGEANDAELYRDDLLKGELHFSEIIKKAKINFHIADILPFARWVTPRDFSKRFDTRFFIAKAPLNQIAREDGREAVSVKWVKPYEFIDEFREELMFPTIMNLKLLAQSNNVNQAFEHARTRKIMTVEPKLIGGIRVIDPAAGYGEVDLGVGTF
ncbi:MAG: NUDIX hydrolase, partial [Emcibacteraceae bacterium]|nr:NUDIX hydrolase [Emcibacteraceae bacterium]